MRGVLQEGRKIGRWGGITIAAVGAVLLVGVSSLYACSKSSPSAATSCGSLAECCPSVPPLDEQTCASVVAQENDSSCAELLASYTVAGSCSIHLTTDSGSPLGDASASCTLLSLCCGDLTGADQTSCNATAALGVAAACGEALSGYQDQGHCGGFTVDSGRDTGTPAFSGPSCPVGKPPASFVGADAGANCLTCVSNCELTSDLTATCASYYGCFCPCAAGDTGCQQACSPLAGDCPDTVQSVATCVASDCASLCPRSSSGFINCQGDAGSTGSPTCGSCIEDMCATQLTAYTSACASFSTCTGQCMCGDTGCEEACESDVTGACEVALMNIESCFMSSCGQPCMLEG